jgi:phosphohistidine phosphatase
MATRTHRLVLLRHAKSAWPEVADHDRPLAGRGRRDAPRMGRWLRDSGHVPGQVLCSTARRARETWQLAGEGLAAAPPVTFEPRIYQASAESLLAVVRETPPPVGTLLVVGHEPAMRDLALTLAGFAPLAAAGPGAGAGAPGLAQRILTKFPTAAAAVLEFGGDWSTLAAGHARMTAFVTPADLSAG